VSNYYRLLDEVRRAFPALIIENCAGGGGRIDLGMLQRTDTVWLSDTTDQFARLSMFMAGTSFLPQRVCENWITYPGLRPGGESSPTRKPPAYDTDFGFRVAMLGNIGVSADLEHVPRDWLARARHHLARYKELRSTIQLGELHRLTPAPPRDGSGSWCAAAMVADGASEAVVFCFRLASGEETAVFRVPGLEPTSTYSVEVDDGGGVEQRSGAQLAVDGIEVTVPRTHSSQLLTLRRLDR
jgi:alpha-galactosidase